MTDPPQVPVATVPPPPVPLLDCDIVMKGGITSGVVYPKAVVRIARTYRIHAIGGTSVGAIAAVLTAAAEYWRRTHPEPAALQQQRIETIVARLDEVAAPDGGGPPKAGWDDWTRADVVAAERALLEGPTRAQGYAGLYAIPGEVGVDLLGKFHPTPQTRGIFQFLIGILAATSPLDRAIAALTRQFYLIRTLAAILACLLTLAFVRSPSLGMILPGVIVALALIGLFQERFWAWLRSRRGNAGDGVDDDAADAPGRDQEQGQDRLRRWVPVAGLALIGLVVALFIEGGLGWGRVFAWIGVKWPLLAAVAIVIVALAVGDGVKRWWARLREPGDAAAQAALLTRLEVASSAVGIIVFAGVLAWQWNAIAEDRQTFGALAVGATLGWLLGGVIGVILNALVFIPRNHNGICTGLQGEDGPLVRRFPQIKAWLARRPGYGARSVALTDWLTDKIDRVAQPLTGGHLTFGDLDDALHRHPNGDDTGIALEMITSELRRNLPLNLPGAFYRYGFKPGELARFFPESVVATLLEPGADVRGMTVTRFPQDRHRLPVVIAARMSMSFPVLFSTVPVYYIGAPDDPSRLGQERRQAPLADGGIVSNFPIHMFDRALSPWPTFAIDLLEIDAGRPTAAEATDERLFKIVPIPIPHLDDAPAQDSATAVAETSSDAPIDSLPALFSHILSTARGWMDNSQKTLPGYAERIVSIHLFRGEGGLNLTMSHETIELLANRGMRGVDRLVSSWDPTLGTGSQWRQHRWLRYRILMRSMENIGQEWKSRYAAADRAGGPSIADLVAEASAGQPYRPAGYHHRWAGADFGAEAGELTGLFDAFAQATPGANVGETGAERQPTEGVFDQPVEPTPEPRLLMVPPFQ